MIKITFTIGVIERLCIANRDTDNKQAFVRGRFGMTKG